MYQYTLKNKSSYIVRKAFETDLEQLIEVMLEVAKEDDVALLTFEEASSKILEAKERLRVLIANDSAHFFYLIGVVAGKVIAFCDIHPGQNKKDKHVVEFGRSVLPAWRRSGAGKYLQESAIDYVKKLGTIEKIKLNINSNNINSIESCKSNGFVEESRREKELKLDDGTYLDLISFVKYI